MKFCHKYLVAKQLAPADDAEFKKLLYDIWFKLYNRTGRVRFFQMGLRIGECFFVLFVCHPASSYLTLTSWPIQNTTRTQTELVMRL